jgi:hypothetical protein
MFLEYSLVFFSNVGLHEVEVGLLNCDCVNGMRAEADTQRVKLGKIIVNGDAVGIDRSYPERVSVLGRKSVSAGFVGRGGAVVVVVGMRVCPRGQGPCRRLPPWGRRRPTCATLH